MSGISQMPKLRSGLTIPESQNMVNQRLGKEGAFLSPSESANKGLVVAFLKPVLAIRVLQNMTTNTRNPGVAMLLPYSGRRPGSFSRVRQKYCVLRRGGPRVFGRGARDKNQAGSGWPRPNHEDGTGHLGLGRRGGFPAQPAADGREMPASASGVGVPVGVVVMRWAKAARRAREQH